TVVLTASSAVFFFSSRRRHTRFSRDWSSDVCSSDLLALSGSLGRIWLSDATRSKHAERPSCPCSASTTQPQCLDSAAGQSTGLQIGRASCRARVWIAEGGV